MIKKIILGIFAFLFLCSLASCKRGNGGEEVKEYSFNYQLTYSEENLSLETLIANIESQYNQSLEQDEFSASISNGDVLTYTNNNFLTTNVGETQVVLSGAKQKVTINIKIAPSVKVLASETMKQGNSQSVSVKFQPAEAKEDFEIVSSNPDVVSVYSGNKLRAEQSGTSTITVTTASGFEYSFTITVSEVVYDIVYEIPTEYEEFITGELPTTYQISDLPLELPGFDCPGYAFFGWQVNPIGEDYTIENLVTSIPKDTKGRVILRPIILRSRLELRHENTSVIEPDQTLAISFETFNVPATMTEIVWESLNADIASVDQEGNVTGISQGVAEIFAYLKDMPDVNMSICVSVENDLDGKSDLLDYLKSIAINEIVTKRITVIAYQGNYTTYMYSGVSLYLFEDLKIIEQITDKSMSNRPGDIYEKHYITVHDTASGAEGANAKSHANYVNDGGEGTSWHYSVGNDGIYHQIPDNERAFHAGDGKRPYELFATGVKGTNKYPEVTISTDGYYVLDGNKTKVAAPKIVENGVSSIATTADINDFGIRVVLQEGEYYIGLTYYNDTYNKISNGGGNCNAIGIEMCVNKNSDIFYTWQKNAKLVAKLLYDNNLTIDDVKPHHFFSGKDCPATMLHAEMWDMFIDMVEVEYKIRSEYSGYKISITTSDPSFIGNNGKVLKQAPLSRTISYTITVEKDGISESITLATVIPGRLAIK